MRAVEGCTREQLCSRAGAGANGGAVVSRTVGERDRRIAKVFGEMLRELRLKRKLSQEKLARLSNCHRNYISELERGRQGPSLYYLIHLARAVGVSPGDLVNWVESR